MITKKRLRDNRLMLSLNDDQAAFVQAKAAAVDQPEATWIRSLIQSAMLLELQQRQQQLMTMQRQAASA
jgi:hypothetical protein